MSTVFIGKISDNDKNEAKAGDDAGAIQWIDLGDVDNKIFGFDHKTIISDYKKWKQFKGTYWSSRKR